MLVADLERHTELTDGWLTLRHQILHQPERPPPPTRLTSDDLRVVDAEHSVLDEVRKDVVDLETSDDVAEIG